MAVLCRPVSMALLQHFFISQRTAQAEVAATRAALVRAEMREREDERERVVVAVRGGGAHSSGVAQPEELVCRVD